MNGNDQKNGNNGNGRSSYLREIAAIGSIALSIFTFTKVVFFAGSDVASVQEHLRYDDLRLDRHELQFADAKEVNVRLTFIERGLQDDREILKEQTKVIEEIQMEMQKKGIRK